MVPLYHILECFFYKWVSFSLWIARRRQWQPTPVLLPGKSHGWRSLVGCHLWGRTESDTTETAAAAAWIAKYVFVHTGVPQGYRSNTEMVNLNL